MNKCQGFTIVETLVAIAILMIAIAGPLTIAQKGLMASVYARDQSVATFLAQDLMEYLKNVRDNSFDNVKENWFFPNVDWECNNFYFQCSVETVSEYDFDNLSGLNGCNGSCYLYNRAEGEGLIGYHLDNSGGVKSQFSRSFYIEELVYGTEARIVVTVSWKTGTIENVVTLENNIFNLKGINR